MVENGEIVVHGPRAHLFYDGPVLDHEFRDFELMVDGRPVVDYTEPSDAPTRLTGGTIALQGHDPGSEVHYRNIRIRPLVP